MPEHSNPSEKRSTEEILKRREILQQVVTDIWEKRNEINSKPVPLPPELTPFGSNLSVAARDLRDGIVIGLFDQAPDGKTKGVGQFVFERESDSLKSGTSDVFVKPRNPQSHEIANNDLYFAPIAQIKDFDAMSVDLKQAGKPKDPNNNYRGKGVGSLLLDVGFMVAKEAGYDNIHVESSNPASFKMMERSGYPITDKTPTRMPDAIWYDYTIKLNLS